MMAILVCPYCGKKEQTYRKCFDERYEKDEEISGTCSGCAIKLDDW